jgi:hypothetical protein
VTLPRLQPGDLLQARTNMFAAHTGYPTLLVIAVRIEGTEPGILALGTGPCLQRWHWASIMRYYDYA